MSFRALSRLAFAALFIAWSLPYLQSRKYTLGLILKNKPESLPEINELAYSSLKYPGILRNCEDGIMIEEDGFAILSCDPGRDLWNTVMGMFYPDHSKIPDGGLWVYNYHLPEEESLMKIELEDYQGPFSFHPLGVEYHRDSGSLFVCNHHTAGSRVDIFSLNVDIKEKKATAKHTRSIIHPLLRTPNSVVALSERELYVTNDHYIRRKNYPLLALTETYAGIPGGTVAYVNLSTEKAEVKTVARGPFANGITLLNESTVAVAFTAAAEVRLYSRGQDNTLTQIDTIKMPFLPDNISTDENGALLIAGHPHPPSLYKTVHARRECIDENGAVSEECWKSSAPSWVARWTPDKGLEDLYVSSKGLGSSATVAKDARRNVGIVTGLYESGILVWRE